MRRYVMLIMLLAAVIVRAEEGFWTFDDPPIQQLSEKYGFTMTPEWLEHVQKSSVRFNNGGSASLISADGLILTNYHVGMDLVMDLSTPEKNYMADGFLAKTLAAEIPTTDLEINILDSITDVTVRVKKAGEEISDPAAAKKARDAEIARIEAEETKATGLRCNVIKLYNGGMYKVFRYQKYTDIRLVFAPSFDTAFFGGELDNYTFPRYSLDMALFRVYENDKPLKCEHYLPWNNDGAAAGELIFVSGNPGSTDRLSTVAQFAYDRDYALPSQLRNIERGLKRYRAYAVESPEKARQVQVSISGLENMKKRVAGFYQGLKDSAVFNRHVEKEQKLRARIAADPELQEKFGPAWDNIASILEKNKKFLQQDAVISGGLAWSGLFSTAWEIVELVEELQKPNEDRLPDYQDSNLESLYFDLYAPSPIFMEKELVRLEGTFMNMIEELGHDDPLVQQVLDGHTPTALAQNALANTTLDDPDARRKLVAGGPAAVKDSDDSLIALARRLNPLLRELDDRHRDEISSVIEQNSSLIADAMFALDGTAVPPDANFTPRLSFGVVQGYPYNGTLAPYKTTLYGLFDRAHSFDQEYPFVLPGEVAAVADKLDMTTPFNFVFTADSVGGNSGSPVINQKGELVGLLFDGNIESIICDYVFSEESARSVAVHPAIMIEFLSKVYAADHLVKEIRGE